MVLSMTYVEVDYDVGCHELYVWPQAILTKILFGESNRCDKLNFSFLPDFFMFKSCWHSRTDKLYGEKMVWMNTCGKKKKLKLKPRLLRSMTVLASFNDTGCHHATAKPRLFLVTRIHRPATRSHLSTTQPHGHTYPPLFLVVVADPSSCYQWRRRSMLQNTFPVALV